MIDYRMPGGRAADGFTLVELAIVMIIIGLLIGGILKGQQLIENSRVAATIDQIQKIESAFFTFRDIYPGIPGDMGNGGTRIPGCENICTRTSSASNNGTLGNNPWRADATIDSENYAAWAQMAAADLISGVLPNSLATDVPTPGVNMPVSALGSSYQIGSSTSTGALHGTTSSMTFLRAVYLQLDNSVERQVQRDPASPDYTLTILPRIVEKMDRKLDDGNPNTGRLLAIGSTGGQPTRCASSDANDGFYRSANGSAACGLYYRLR